MSSSDGAICMAVYRPDSETLAVQIDSLRAQSVRDWTCEIAIDGGTPEDLAVVRACVDGDERFHVVSYPERVGFYRNFERALQQVGSQAEWVALADQDDHWYPDKLERLLPALDRAVLVTGQARVVRQTGTEVVDEGVTARRWTGLFADQLDNTVTGSFSVFRASVARAALPFPAPTDAAYHDHWIGVCAAALGPVEIVDVPLQDYIQHGQNVLGEAQGGRWSARLRAWRTRAGGAFSVRYVADHRWGWRVTMARTLPDRVDTVPRAVLDDIRPVWRGRISFRLLVRSLGVLMRREAPAGRIAALLVGAMATPRRRGEPWTTTEDVRRDRNG